MQATASAGLLTWFWLAILGGASGLPAGGPPLPLDPQLSAIAPEECLLYMAHAGYGDADPRSDHPTEQLYAEPQIERFAAEIGAQLQQVVRRRAGSSSSERVLVEEGPKLAAALVSRPSVFYVEDAQMRAGRLEVEAALVVHAGDQFRAVRTAIERVLKAVEQQGRTVRQEFTAELEWKRIDLWPGAPAVRIGYYEQYVIVALGDKTPANLNERSNGTSPQWLDDLRREHAVEREIAVTYVNVQGIVERIRTVASEHSAWTIAAQLGLGAIEELHTVAGFDSKGCVRYSHLVTGGGREGLLSLLPYKPLGKRDLEMIPADVLLAAACRVDLDEVFDAAILLAEGFNPDVEEEIEEALYKIETEIGVDLHEDVLHALGDVWIAYVPAGDLTSSWLGSAAAVRVKDRDRLDRGVRQFVGYIRRASSDSRRGNVVIRESTREGRTIYWLEFVGQPLPVAPAWSVSDEWLVVGLLPQTISEALDREDQPTLADIEAVEAALTAADGPAALAYQDTPQVVRSIYPWLQMGLQAISAPLRNEGIEVDVSAMPSASVIVKHLRPSVSTMTHRSDGYHAAAYTSLGSGANLVTAAPVMAGLLLPAISEARSRARTVQETNNLRQIALAVLNYESANGHLPTNVYDDQGNALLSWRVKILPYMEENRVYEQIRMDEPWDSPHNRQLGDNTPLVFQSVSEPTPPGKTRMLALAGAQTIWPGNQEVRFRDIRDGTSNTLMVVHANADAAVDWMKPEDINFDPESPFAGLQNARGQVLVVFCDGHARPLSLSLDPEIMRALATRAGGEVISHEELDIPANSGRSIRPRSRR